MDNPIRLGNKEDFWQLQKAKEAARMKFLALEPNVAQEIISSLFIEATRELNSTEDEDFSSLESDQREYCLEMKYTPAEVQEIFHSIKDLNIVLVGGQAVNLWASFYREDNLELSNYLPFSSEDLDFYGGKLDAMEIRNRLGGELILNNNFDPSPNTAILLVNFKNKKLRLDFLGSVFGISDSEIASNYKIISLKEAPENQLKVLHPILCLEGKLKSVVSLPQQGRQDLKHLKMSVLFVKEFLKEICRDEQPKEGLKLIERIVSNTISETGLTVWLKHQVDLESAIPFDRLQSLTNPKWQNFREIRLPQIQSLIAQRREKYLELIKILESKQP